MTIFRSKLRMLHAGLIALLTLSMVTIIKVEYFDARPVQSSLAGRDDVIITVKKHPLYVTRLQARERSLAIVLLFVSAFGGVIVSRHLRSEDGNGENPWRNGSS